MDIVHAETNGRGRYYWAAPDGAEAELTYSRAGEHRLIVDHTFTPPQHRGKDIALRLVERLIADARKSGDRIVPLCPYVAKQFRAHDEWSDLLA